VKIRFEFIAYRRATCATETPGARACRQIERFSSSDQNRFLCPFLPAIECLKMSIVDHGHYPQRVPNISAATTDGYDRSFAT
jgi:hypothetical protein